MTFGEGNDVDVAIVVRAAGIGQGHRYGLVDNYPLDVSVVPEFRPGRAFVSVLLSFSAKNQKGQEGEDSWGRRVRQ